MAGSAGSGGKVGGKGDARPGPARVPSKKKPGAGGSSGGPGNRTLPAPRSGVSPTLIAWGSVGIVIVIVAVLVVIKVTNGSTSTATPGGSVNAASANIVAAVTGVPWSVVNQIGIPPSSATSSSSSPNVVMPLTVKNQPALTSNGHPAVVYVGAEYCPYCAAERWAIVEALSRFGTFSGLKETTSSGTDAFPNTITFSFAGSTYTSSYITFLPSEIFSNTPVSGGGYTALDKMTTVESNLFTKYDSNTYFPSSNSPQSFPFIDLGNRVFVQGSSYTPGNLTNLDDSQVVADLVQPSTVVAQSINGTASYLTAAVCSLTGQQPSKVCSQSAIVKASQALKLS